MRPSLESPRDGRRCEGLCSTGPHWLRNHIHDLRGRHGVAALDHSAGQTVVAATPSQIGPSHRSRPIRRCPLASRPWAPHFRRKPLRLHLLVISSALAIWGCFPEVGKCPVLSVILPSDRQCCIPVPRSRSVGTIRFICAYANLMGMAENSDALEQTAVELQEVASKAQRRRESACGPS
jgi:hypothetical protein